jgi:hypothetical protein
MAKKIDNRGTAVWINEIGSITLRVFEIVKEDKEKKTIIIKFNKNEIYEIRKNNIRARRVIIYQKSNGKIIAQNPDNISQLNLDEQKIKILRFNLQNSSLQESKAAIHRWAPTQDLVDKLGPIFKLMFICIAVGVIGWAAFKYAGVVLDLVARSRILECSQLFPYSPTPVGVNLSAPVGI